MHNCISSNVTTVEPLAMHALKKVPVKQLVAKQFLAVNLQLANGRAQPLRWCT